jgi:hypothetical protein
VFSKYIIEVFAWDECVAFVFGEARWTDVGGLALFIDADGGDWGLVFRASWSGLVGFFIVHVWVILVFEFKI